MKLAYLPNWAFLDRIQNSTGPVDIDTCGNDYNMYQKGNIGASNVGGFTKRGAGAIVFWTDLAYTGPTTVLEGKLLMRGGLDNAGGKITVAEGAQLNLFANSLTYEDGTPVVLLKGEVDEESAKRIVATGINKEVAISIGAEGQDVYMTTSPAVDSVYNRWIGLVRDNWSTAENWTKGVPQDTHTIAFDYSCHLPVNGNKTVDQIVLKPGVEVEFLSTDASKVHPSVWVTSLAVEGEGEAIIALNHVGIQSRNGQYETPQNIHFRMNNTWTDSWLKHLNLNGKLLGKGIFRQYACNFRGDNSEFEGTIQIRSGTGVPYIYSAAAGASKATWEIEEDVHLDIEEGVFQMGAVNFKNQKLWYTKDNSTAVIEVGHLNTDFGCFNDTQYFFGPGTYDPEREVPSIRLRKVGTGKMKYAARGIRYIEVAEGTLELGQCTASNTHFSDAQFHGNELTEIVVKKGAALTGSSGTQPIYSLTLEPGAILKTTLSEVTTGEGEDAVTTVVQSSWPTVTGSVNVQGAYGVVEGAELLAPKAEYTLLDVTGEGNSLTGYVWLQKDETYPKGSWVVKTRPQTLDVGKMTGFILMLR